MAASSSIIDQICGRAGDFAVRFTEGGYCSMYSTGRRLAGSGELNDRIAKACGHVYTDEAGHMRDGFIRLSQSEQTADQWDEMADMVRRILSVTAP